MKLLDADLNVFSLWKILAGLLGRTATSEGPIDAGLRANLFGFGKNDETLFWEAVALAENKGLMKKPQGRENISFVLGQLEYWQKKHFFQMIGKDTQSITIEVHKEPDDSPLRGRRRTAEGEKDKSKVEKTTMQGNLRGAMIIAFFAEMPRDDAVAILKNSGTLTGLTDDIKEVYGRVLGHLNQEKFAPLKQAFLRNLQELEAADRISQEAYESNKQKYTAFSRRNWVIVAVVFAALLLAVGIWG